ncbi:phosphatidylethanolamine binding protein [Trichuris trichiura]|uniref:Large ribosomal subunit protein mL38 n=1 Tax=Trichuris trichiura TaxID=36087 RepID=A0A077ZA12_TRITR|nr:phosphatidylethanolamine binding protein [Trichuris trichiura]
MRQRAVNYADIYIKTAYRARRTPRVCHAWRTRKLMSLTAFFRNRFYEIDRWYKARIEKPIIYPQLYTIDPSKFSKSLKERLAEANPKDADKINIGFKWARNRECEHDEIKEDDTRLELEARKRTLKLDLQEVEEEGGIENEPQRLKLIAEHFGIYEDLFEKNCFFYPVVNLRASFSVDTEDGVAYRPVYFGNLITPTEACAPPLISYKADGNSYWTLVMVNPDGNIYADGNEVLHWLICNIPGDDVSSGDVLCNYLQPLPLRGTGLHRFVLVLFKQNSRRQFTAVGSSAEQIRLDERTFSLLKFYMANEDYITPAGLAFFQCEWDKSCSVCFREKLDMKEPFFAYNWPPPYVPPQQIIPDEPQPFNLYLDKYRPLDDIEAELLRKRLARVSVRKGDQPRLPYPNIFYYKDKHFLPSWLHLERYKENLGLGKYKAIYENPLD